MSLLILAGAGIAFVAMLFNLRAMEKKQISDFKALARSITDTSLNSIFRGQSENMMRFVLLLSQMPNIQHVGYWVEDKRVLFAGPETALEKDLLYSSEAFPETVLAGHYLYFSEVTLPLLEDGKKKQTLLQIVFSLDDFIAKKNNILLAGLLIGGLLVLLVVMIQWISRLYRQLDRAEQVKSGMISAITHDANSYLTVIKGKVDNILYRMDHEIPQDDMRRKLVVAHDNIASLIRLNADLSDHERLARGKMRMHLTGVEYTGLLEDVIAGLQESARQKGQTIDFSKPAGETLVKADKDQLKRVFHNVLQNAIKFSGPGTRIRVVCQDRADRVEVRFTDQGPGIAPQDRLRIFEAFVRLDTKVKGTGLGLSISRQLVREMGGELTVLEGQPDEGAVFSVMLIKQENAIADGQR